VPEGRYTNDDSFDVVLPMLRGVRDVMRERLRTNRERFGDSNFWHGFGGRDDARAVVVLIDEIQTWTSPAVTDRTVKADAAEFVGLVTDIAKKGRSAGVCLLIATQKPTSDALPSGLRDVCAKRYAFRCTTTDMAKAALGVIPEGEPSPVDIAFGDKGLCVASADSGGTEFIRWDYLPEKDIEPLLRGDVRMDSRS
jgi:hypothetical protein